MSRINLPRSRFVKNPEPHSQETKATWSDIRNATHHVNPDLATIIDELTPEYPLLINEYDYGFVIANCTTHNHPRLILQSSCELFLDYQDRQPIYRMYQPGELLFSENAFDHANYIYQSPLWKLVAGCRNVFMLSKITDHKSHTALLKHYQISRKKPQSLNDHWQMFKLIANSKIHNETDKWKVKTLSFGKEWFSHNNDPEWQKFYQYFERSVLQQNQTNLQKPWLDSLFGILQHEKHIKLTLPQMEQASYLIQILLGGAPGFSPALDESRLPIKLITEAYLEHYGLNEYAPIIMTPSYIHQQPTVYYSFNHPTSHLMSPVTNQRKTLVQNALMAHWAFNKIRDLSLNKEFVLDDSQLHLALQNCDFDFYHDEAVNYPPFKLPEEIIKNDPHFMQDWSKYYLQAHSHFLNGCVRITYM